MNVACITAVILGVLSLPALAQVRTSYTSPGPPPTLEQGGAAGAADGSVELWDQIDLGLNAWLDQAFTDIPDSSSYLVNDVSTAGATWRVTKVTTYYTQGIAGSWSPGTITGGLLQVFPKTGPLPDNGADLAPEYIVPVTLVDEGGIIWRVEADTSGIAELGCISGAFWIGLTPITDFSVDGQEYHWATSQVSSETAFRNPGGDIGLGTDWISLSAADTLAIGPPYEASITLEGEVLAESWVPLGPATALLSAFWGDFPTASGAGLACAGSVVTISGTHCGPPFGSTTLVAGLFNISLPFKGGTMVPSPDVIIPLPTGASGDLAIPFLWPAGLPPGLKLYMQFWQNEPPWSASNGLEVTAL